MPDLLTTLDRRWASFATSTAGCRTLSRWQADEPVLAGLATLAALTDAARDLDGADLERRDQLHLALLRIAGADDDARYAILHLLHPALVATARLYSDTWDREEATSLVVAAALERIIRYPHGLPRPAASIVRWVRRSMWNEAQRLRARHQAFGYTTSLDDALPLPHEPQPSPSEELLELLGQAVHDGILDEARARLVVLHRVLGVPTADIAELEGYPPSTIRQRRNRAEAALVQAANRYVA